MTQTDKQQTPKANGTQVYAGACHCGTVRYEAELDLSGGGTRCNCSICLKVGSTNLTVKPQALRLLAGAENLGEYRVGTSPNSRSFCKRCGIHVFGQGHVEQLGGDFVSINLNSLDDVEVSAIKVQYWDGRHDNWAAGMRPEPWPMLP